MASPLYSVTDRRRPGGSIPLVGRTGSRGSQHDSADDVTKCRVVIRGAQQLQGYYGVNSDPTVAPLAGPVPPDTQIPLAIGLSVRDPAGLKSFIADVSDPKSPNFRKFLTQAQFTATYGATAGDYQALQDWANTSGFSTWGTYSNNLLLSVSGTAAQIESALYVNLVYRLNQDGQPFVAVDREPSLDLSVPILRISGLAEFRVPRRAGGTGGGGSLRAADLRNAYLGADPAILALDGTGQVVGLLELNSFALSDITGYDALQVPPLNPANVVLAAIAAPPWFTGYSNSPETASDIELVQAMAPAAQVLVFQTALGVTLHGDAVFHAMANSNPPLTSASCSYNFGRSDNSEQALDQMAARGVSFFTASGDYGDIGDPQSNLDMLSQTLVGGTFLATNTITAPPAYPSPYYAGETTETRRRCRSSRPSPAAASWTATTRTAIAIAGPIHWGRSLAAAAASASPTGRRASWLSASGQMAARRPGAITRTWRWSPATSRSFTMAARPGGSAPARRRRCGPASWRSSTSALRSSTPMPRPPASSTRRSTISG
jgi:hypothetical protein